MGGLWHWVAVLLMHIVGRRGAVCVQCIGKFERRSLLRPPPTPDTHQQWRGVGQFKQSNNKIKLTFMSSLTQCIRESKNKINYVSLVSKFIKVSG